MVASIIPNITFNPTTAKQGDVVAVGIAVAGFAVDKVELWGYTIPNHRPPSEQNFAKIGEFAGATGTVLWDTSQWPAGQLYLAVVAYYQGRPVLSWNRDRQDVANFDELVTFVLDASASNAPGAPSAPGEIPWGMLALAGAVALGGYYYMKKGQD